ncbi:Response regulator of the LytR/AlgR family protein [Thiorhodovibrio winogradskyi]|uniref:Response regulator of the LytR/AlgR family protein n=1 Tax=Thiorhodovibrio winogradskyi TaxID=77007 RepID=A0ABZ0SDT6_9GAMM|nr:hypothetical protein [Thiorhodovibrio winogradskyi]
MLDDMHQGLQGIVLEHDVGRLARDLGTAPLEAIRAAPPEVVFLDLGLPDMDGLAVARELATWPERQTLTLVALSGYSLAEEPEAETLFEQRLMKPAKRADFERVLAAAGGPEEISPAINPAINPAR